MAIIEHNGAPDFEYGVSDRLSDNVRRIICNNPGSFTFTGTGTYIIGNSEVAVIDPGPADEQHINAILAATQGESITHILVTHTHIDHSPGCRYLQRHCDAPSYAFGPHGVTESGGGFGADLDFQPDHRLQDGETLSIGDLDVQAVHTPGHASNHLSFYLSAENALFCGDVVMGWSTTIVSPPDGNMKDYMASLQTLLQRDDSVYYPTHGAPIPNPLAYVRQLHAHRTERENQVLECIRQGIHKVPDMLPLIYQHLDRNMFPAAERSLFATVECLAEQGRLVTDNLSINAMFYLPSDDSNDDAND